jgi:hypothetical protein
MKWVYGFILLILAILVIDLASAHASDFYKRRKREKAARKYGMLPGAFKPVKASSWWLQ